MEDTGVTLDGSITLHPVRNHLLGVALDIRLSDGRTCWITHSWMVRLDDFAAPAQIVVVHI